MFWNLWFKKPKIVENKFTLTADKFIAVKPESFGLLYSSDYSIIQVTTYCKNILNYTSLLKRLVEALQSDRQLYTIDLPLEITKIYLRDFFTNESNQYIDAKQAIAEFLEIAVVFIKLYDSKEKQINKSFQLEKSLFLTQGIINNLITLSEELSNVGV